MLIDWALAIAFTGITVGAIVQFNTLTSEQKKKYRWGIIIALVLIWVGTVIQMVVN